MSNTDDNSFSVSNPTTPSGTPKKNSLHVQINQQLNAPAPLSPSSSEKFNIKDFEQILLGSGNMIESRNKATEEICQLKKHNKELERELESVVSKPSKEGNDLALQQRVVSMNITAANPSNENTMAEAQQEDLEIAEHYKTLTVELEAKIEILVATLSEKDSQMQKIRQQYEEILTSLEDKENRIVDLEFELLSMQKGSGRSDKSFLEKVDSGSEKHSSFYRQEIEEKDKEITKLSIELKKCTCYLQEIVNKELWERNKEIEKLQNKQANPSEVSKLKKELASKDYQLRMLKEKNIRIGFEYDHSFRRKFGR
ncbi:hypothetical protein NQ317_017118 [Molorchus minor]|uniref:Uncharacterized protein n=1 Tax=Molorchus minor TaxID=1323400 RepID=A0ABQ9JHA1_9CUCU|nr:hypothetical protein NQ317_017118 [Molorchus minor]